MATSESRAELSGKAINDLPDSAFAYIEPGGKKDSEGKTIPRSLRHFPVQDEAHAKNALSRAPQSPFGEKAMPKILAACKKFGIEVSEKKSDEGVLTESETRAQCPTCEGTGKIMDGNRECPDCHGTGERSSSVTPTRRRKQRHRAVALMPEVRFWRASDLEVRSSTSGDKIVISGTPIVYNTDYEVHDVFGAFQERMSPGVATNVLKNGADVRFLFNHDGLPLARTLSGTLTLSDTPTHLEMRAELDPRQQLANDLAIATERGDVDQMSCGFIVSRDEWDEDEEHRDVQEFADLLDVSAVTYPASPTTSLQIAHRMAMEVPVESRARLRRIYAELRAGKVLSAGHQAKLVDAAHAIHSVLVAAGYSPEPLQSESDDDDTDEQEEDDYDRFPGHASGEDGTSGGSQQEQDGGPGVEDGTGTRKRRSAAALRFQQELLRRKIKV